jgi:hypothetical protein
MNRPRHGVSRRTRLLGLEHLEKRTLLSTFTWINNADGSFVDPNNWRDQNGNHGVPGPSDTASIGFTQITVTIPQVVSVNIISDSATLHITNGGGLTLGNAAGNSAISSLILDSGGTLETTGGTTSVGTSTVAGTFNVGTGATLDINGPLQANAGTSFLGSGLYDVTGTLDINADMSAPVNLELDSGSINTATSSVDFASPGVVNWYGGAIGGNGTFEVAAKGTMNLVGNSAKSMSGSAILKIDASASVLYSGLGTLGGSGLEIDNYGKWTMTNDANLTDGNLSFNNYGTFTKTTDGQGHGVGTSTLSLNTFNNFSGGTVDSRTGTILFFDQSTSQESGTFDAEAYAVVAFGYGSFTLNAGTSLVGAGDFLIQNLNDIGGVTVTVDYGVSVAPPNLNLASGTLNVLGTVSVAANGTWTGGTITGTGSVNFLANSTLNITGSAEKDLVGSTINNAGFAVWTGTGAIVGNNGSVINNSGTFTASSDNTFSFSGGTEVSFNNSGTFTKASPTGSGTTTFYVNALNNSGTVNVNSGTLSLEPGSTTQFESGTFNVASGARLDFAESQLANATTQLNAGTKFQGTGLAELDSGNLTVNAPVSVPNFTMTGGTQNGASTLTITTAFNWTGGSLDSIGTTTVAPGATLSLSGSNSNDLTNGHVLNNQGTGTWTGTGEFDGNLASTFNNSGTFTAASDTSFNGGGGGGFVFNNSGTFTKTSTTATGTTSFIFDVLNNSGTIDVNSGILSLNGVGTESGIFSVATGARLVFSGTASNDIGSGTLELNAGTKFQGTGLYEQDGGTLSVNAPLSFVGFNMTGGTLAVPAMLTTTGTFNWSGGTINGSGSVNIPSGVQFNIVGASQKTLDLATTSNAGLVVWTGQGQIYSHGGAVFNNLAGGTFDAQNDEDLVATFNNSGTFTKTSATGTGTTSISYVLNNLAGGVVDVISGNLATDIVTNNGTISLAPSTTLNVFVNNFSGGNFTQTAAGTLAIQVGGAPATGRFGHVVIGSAASLNGTLAVTLVNGFEPTAGQVFPILTYGTNSGDFTTKNLPTTNGAPIFSTTRKATEYDLNAIATVQPAAVETTDYDGDGKSDLGVFRVSTAQWLVVLSSGGTLTPAPTFGAANLSDIPVPGDYDGVGHTELAVFRPSTGQWFIQTPNGGVEVKSFGGINLSDIPVPGDYDGVGHTELAVFRPSTGQWLIAGPNGLEIKSFGATNLFDIPVPGDYDGVGHTELAVFRPSTGQWFIQGHAPISFGAPNLFDLPVPGDYTGSGKTELAVFRPSTAQWIIQTPGGGTLMPTFGAPNLFDVPLNPVDAALVALGRVHASSVATIQTASVSVAPASSPAVVIAPAEAPAQKSSRGTQDLWLLAVEHLARDGF